MTKEIVTITKGSRIIDAAVLMRKKDISCIIVKCGDVIEGIVTERDILRKIIANQKDYNQIIVSDIMTSPVATVEEDATITEAINNIYGKHIRRLVVVDANGKMMGIVTESDFLKALMKAK